MFKGRLGVWITVIALCIGIPFLIDNVPKWIETQDILIVSEIDDANVAENILDNRYGEYVVKTSKNNADIIITSTMDEVAPNYTKKDDMLYSPLVMYVENSVDSHNSGFISVEKDNYNCFKVDLMTILDAMEKEKTWQDIGMETDVINGDVKLYIPDENCWYYKEVENLFYLTLNGGNTPNDNELKSLQPRVEKLLEQCNKVISIEMEIESEAFEPSDNGKVFIAPEYLYMTAKGMGDSTYDCFVPVYFTKTTFVHADFCIKNNSETASDFITTIQNKKHFMKDTGWRIKDSIFDISSVSRHFIKVPI